ncbi:HigA family addiction module antitoxin [Spirosoma sp. KNUC1025]|uniref:HigA family addiction module antitoxin n=1 Tax=Spirosoma sp. KNUC1025 TaxID=2894082 RepID=UPI003864CD1C|nr:HigA family addiction module antitoxin [Spirosoma sp. KNUC1025]
MSEHALHPIHPGKILRENYIKECGLSITEIARGLSMPRPNLSAILNERAGVSAEMAVKLSEAFGNTAQFWTDLQRDYDLWHAEQKVNRSTIRHFWQKGQNLQTA